MPDAVGVWNIGYMYTTADYSVWDASRIKNDNDSVGRSIQVLAGAQTAIPAGISISSMSQGNQQAQVTITNYGDSEIDLGKVGLAVRDPQGINRDAWWEEFKIPAHSTKTHIVGVNFNKTGIWTFEVVSYKNGIWSSSAIKTEGTARQFIRATIN
jgi:hypothetical protein